MELNKQLTHRQEQLYWYLKQQTEYKTLIEIYEDTNNELGYSEWDSYKCSWINSVARRQITKDLQALEKSDYINNIILKNNNGIKVATTREEAEHYYNIKRKEIMNELKRLSKIRKRLLADHQFRITFNKEQKEIKCTND